MTTQLWKRCAIHAVRAPAHVLGGALAGLLAAILWNPLPLVLFAIGSAMWLIHATSSPTYARRMLEQEAHARDADARLDRERRAKALPADYAARYVEVQQLAERIRKAASARPELALEWTLDLEQELSRLLTTYLELAEARLAQLDALSGLAEPSTAQARIDETSAEIARLERLAVQEPAAAAIRRSHIEVLQKRRDQLVECAARDARLAAQLEALPDVFRFLLERVSGAQVDSTALTDYLGGIAAQVEEVQRVGEPQVSKMATPVH